MDYLPTSVTDLIRPFRDSNITVRRRWYPVPEGTPLLGFPSSFTSAHVEPYPWFPRKVGEVYPPVIDYSRRGTPTGFDYSHLCGTIEDFQLGAKLDPTLFVLYDAEWIPLCCGATDVCTTQLCAQAQVNERPAMQLYSYPVPHQTAAPGTPYWLFQTALNQGNHDPAWPGQFIAFYPSGLLGDAGYSFVVVADDSGRVQYQEETIRFDADNAVTTLIDATGYNVTVEQGGVSGSINLAIVGGVAVLSGVNFAISETLLPSETCFCDIVNEFTEPQVITATGTTANTTTPVLTLVKESTATVANGFGESILSRLESASGVVRDAVRLSMKWRTAADATRTGMFQIETFGPSFAMNNAQFTNDGSYPMCGFFGAAPTLKPVASGSVFGFTAGVGTPVTDDATFTGGIGGSAYTIDDIVTALKQLGFLSL